MDIVEGPVRLRFGLYNYRPLSITEGNKLYTSLMEHGVQRFLSENAIPIIVPPNFVDPATITEDENAGETLPDIKWTEEALMAKEVIAPAGRHRHYAVQKIRMSAAERFAGAQKVAEKALAKAKGIQTTAVTNAQGKEEAVRRNLEESSKWMVILYNKGGFQY
jgi:hypothetical protein